MVKVGKSTGKMISLTRGLTDWRRSSHTMPLDCQYLNIVDVWMKNELVYNIIIQYTMLCKIILSIIKIMVNRSVSTRLRSIQVKDKIEYTWLHNKSNNNMRIIKKNQIISFRRDSRKAIKVHSLCVIIYCINIFVTRVCCYWYRTKLNFASY